MRSSPSVMSSRPTIIRSSVDFPQPEGPTRITNSPSAMSRLTPLTAVNPSGSVLTTLSRLIAAIVGSFRASALDCALGEAGDDPALEEQDDDDDRDRHHDRGRRDGAGGLLELGGAGEEGEGRGYRPGSVGGRERDAVDEVVPGDEEGDDRRREHTRGGQGDHRLAKGLEGGGAVHLRGLLQLPGDLAEEGGEGPD